jgi:hypothetical protein
VVRSSSNPISQDASSIFQAQNGLPQVDHPVGIGEECRTRTLLADPHLVSRNST